MKIVLECHAYAPELNKAFVGPAGALLPMPAVTSIKGVRLHMKPLKAFINAIVTTRYEDPKKKWLQCTYSGKVETRSEALSFVRKVRSGLAEGGTALLKTQLIGG